MQVLKHQRSCFTKTKHKRVTTAPSWPSPYQNSGITLFPKKFMLGRSSNLKFWLPSTLRICKKCEIFNESWLKLVQFASKADAQDLTYLKRKSEALIHQLGMEQFCGSQNHWKRVKRNHQLSYWTNKTKQVVASSRSHKHVFIG